MIAVDICVASIGRTYNFNLDETAPVGALIEEAAAMVCSNERWPMPASCAGMELFSASGKKRLERSGTLDEQGVRPGDSLILC